MTERIHFYGFQVPDLKKYLQDRGISCSIGKKIDLVRLCELAEELRLEVLTSANDEEEYSVFDARRRTVAVGNDKIILDPVNAVTEWSKDLASVPDFESCDVLKISDIDMRVDQTHPQPTSATTDSYNPIVPIQGPMANHERDFYELCRGTGALLLQTLYDESFHSLVLTNTSMLVKPFPRYLNREENYL
uniref:SAP domain-containing protein n=1 Tax=Magallana gigas TaxID=29159 RepID=A0A8W8MIK5_MAGGI